MVVSLSLRVTTLTARGLVTRQYHKLHMPSAHPLSWKGSGGTPGTSPGSRLSKRKVQTPAFRRADCIPALANRYDSPPHAATGEELWTSARAVRPFTPSRRTSYGGPRTAPQGSPALVPRGDARGGGRPARAARSRACQGGEARRRGPSASPPRRTWLRAPSGAGSRDAPRGSCARPAPCCKSATGGATSGHEALAGPPLLRGPKRWGKLRGPIPASPSGPTTFARSPHDGSVTRLRTFSP
jgi:hypothetical protein